MSPKKWQKLANFLLTWLEPFKIMAIVFLVVAILKVSILFFLIAAVIILTVRLTVETERQLSLMGGHVSYRPNERGQLLKLNLRDWKFWVGNPTI